MIGILATNLQKIVHQFLYCYQTVAYGTLQFGVGKGIYLMQLKEKVDHL